MEIMTINEAIEYLKTSKDLLKLFLARAENAKFRAKKKYFTINNVLRKTAAVKITKNFEINFNKFLQNRGLLNDWRYLKRHKLV